MKKVLIYSDCFVYSGSENVIENIFRSEDIRKEFELKFYYAYNEEYEKGIKRKFGSSSDVKAIKHLINPYPQWGHPLATGKITGRFRRFYTRFLYVLCLCFNKVGLLQLYNACSLYRFFRREQPAILLINNGGYPGAETCRIAVLSAKLAGIRDIIFVVNNLAYPTKNYFDKKFDQYIGKYVSYFVTASKAAVKALIAARNFDQAKCLDIANTLPREMESQHIEVVPLLRNEFGFKDNTIVLGGVGLLTKRKGYHVLIEAMASLVEDNTSADYKLIIFGEGEERSALELQIAKMGLQDIVYLPGFRPDIMEYMKGIDIFVAPSIANEDFPYVIIEAMMLAKPIIGSRVAGIPEQIDEPITGYVVAAGNPDELKKAILGMCDKEVIKSMGLASRQRYFNHFNNERVMKCYLDLFRSF